MPEEDLVRVGLPVVDFAFAVEEPSPARILCTWEGVFNVAIKSPPEAVDLTAYKCFRLSYLSKGRPAAPGRIARSPLSSHSAKRIETLLRVPAQPAGIVRASGSDLKTGKKASEQTRYGSVKSCLRALI